MTQAVAVVGPTGSGKTALAIALAEALGTEIISADSMQFFRGLEIGSGQPSPEELARVKHHFVGSLDLTDETSAGAFQEQAREIVGKLNEAGKIAVIEGGSGLYVRALIDGIVSVPPKDEALRGRLERELEEQGLAALHARLQTRDPVAAGRISPTDPHKIVRALEVIEATGRPISDIHAEDRERTNGLDALQFAIDWPREELYERINRRVDLMLEAGLVDEVQALLDAGHQADLERLRPIGYLDIAAALQGDTTMEEAIDQMKMFTRRYAKRQLTWFRGDKRVNWLSPNENETATFLAERALETINSSV